MGGPLRIAGPSSQTTPWALAEAEKPATAVKNAIATSAATAKQERSNYRELELATWFSEIGNEQAKSQAERGNSSVYLDL